MADLAITKSDSTATSENVVVKVYSQPRYWITGGTGNWNSTTNWSVSSGGASGASVPTAANDAIFDANSGTGTVTLNANESVHSLDASAFTGAITVTGNRTLTIGGAATNTTNAAFLLNASTNWNAGVGGGTLSLTFDNRGSAMTINTNGALINNAANTVVATTNTATITQLSDFNIGLWQFTLNKGTWVTGAHTLSTGQFNIASTNTKTIDYTNGTIALVWLNGGWSMGGTVANATVTGNSASQITMFGLGNSFTGGGKTYPGTVQFNGNGNATIADANTFTNLSATGTSVGDSLLLAASQTVTGTLTLAGTNQAVRLQVITGNTFGTTVTITMNSGSTAISNVDFQDITALGSVSPFSGISLGDMGGNSGITFTTPVTRHWIGGTGVWGDITHWSATAGGVGSATMPIAQDTAIFDDAAFTANGQTVTINESSIAAFDASAISSHTVNFTQGTVAGGVWHYGNVTLSGQITYTTVASQATYVAKRATQTWTSNGATMSVNATSSPLNIYNFGATFQPQDDFSWNNASSTTSGIALSYGTFNPLGNLTTTYIVDNATIGTHAFTGTSGKTLSLTNSGSSNVLFKISGSGATVTPNNMNVAITDTTSATKSFYGSGATWGDLTVAAGGTGALGLFATTSLGVAKTLTFNSMSMSGVGTKTISFDAILSSSNIYALTTPTFFKGTAGNLITINSDSGTFNLSSTSTVVTDYISLTNSVAAGGTPFFAGLGSTNGGGNTNWTFNVGFVGVSDTTNTTQDVVNIAIADQINIHDNIATSEFVAVSIPVNVTAADTTTTSDSVQLGLESRVAVADTITTTDTPHLSIDLNVTASDATTITENLSMSQDANIALAETTTVSDAPLVQIQSGISLSDTILTIDLVALSAEANLSVSDQVTLGENVLTGGSGGLIANDQTTLSENVQLAVSGGLVASDVIVSSENIQVTLGDNNIQVSDSVATSDVAAILVGELVLNASDSITTSDTANVIIMIPGQDTVIVSDSSTVTELVSVTVSSVLALQVATSDTTTLVDVATVNLVTIAALQVVAADNVSVAENRVVTIVSLLLSVAVSDAVSINEALAILVVVGSVAGFMEFFE